MSTPPVVVGVDGSADGLIALAWATAYADARELPLRVVHVIDDERHPDQAEPLHAGSASYDDEMEVLGEAADQLAASGRHLKTKLELHHGNPAQTLLRLAETADLLVIGRRGMCGFAELVLGSTSQLCTALARSRVVVVPDSWRPDAVPAGRIVVGVDGSGGSHAALAFGFEVAALSGAELVAVHAADLRPNQPEPILWLDPEQAPWRARGRHLLDTALAGWREKFPEVRVDCVVEAGHPVQVLTAASATADLVVVGGLGRTEFTSLRLGSVARGLLHHTHSPIAVIHLDT